MTESLRVTWRPWAKVTSVTRYEYQWSTVQTAPDWITGLPEVESAKMTSHIIAEDLSWTPWSRLFLQAGFNYVLSEMRTPASDFTQAILAAQNNYWTLNFSSGFVLDDKSDLNVNCFYYRADNYQDNSSFGVPYGAGGEEQGITATLVRRLTKNLRVSLKYRLFSREQRHLRRQPELFVATGVFVAAIPVLTRQEAGQRLVFLGQARAGNWQTRWSDIGPVRGC